MLLLARRCLRLCRRAGQMLWRNTQPIMRLLIVRTETVADNIKKAVWCVFAIKKEPDIKDRIFNWLRELLSQNDLKCHFGLQNQWHLGGKPEGTGAQALDELQALPAEDKHRRSQMRLRRKKKSLTSKSGFLIGGEAEIRTLGGVAPSTVFKTAALNHSATSPAAPSYLYDRLVIVKCYFLFFYHLFTNSPA